MHKITQPLLQLTCVAILVFLMPISFNGSLLQANAQGRLVSDIGNTIQNTLQTISAQFLEQKELVLDGLFFDIAQQALQQMIGDMVEWVNSGFDGEPAYITNYEKHFKDSADEVAGDFIYGDSLSTICETFKIDVTVAAAENYQKENSDEGFKEEVQCTVDDIGDHEAFLKGDFYAGGWSMWLEIILNPENTAIGALTIVESEHAEKQLENKEIEEVKILANDGFQSQEVCDGDECRITTPGIIIKEQLANALNAPMLSLINADEMNEVIGSLFGNLANQAFQGINGLLGLGGNISFTANGFGSNGGSYLDAVREESANKKPGSTGTGNRIDEALKIQTRLLQLQLDIVAAIDEVNTTFQEAHAPFTEDSCWSLVFPTSLEEKLADLLKEVPETISTIITLEELAKAHEEADSSTAQLEVLKKFSGLQSEGLLSGQAEIIESEFYFKNELKSVIEKFGKEIIAEETSC